MLPSIRKFKYVSLFFITPFIYGQQATHSPSPQNNTPIDLNNLFDVIVFIVFPVGLFILYFLWRKQVKKNRENKNEK
jgi:heme/copper-type cytochrome/quinol oxidase subunit 2